MQKNNIDIVRRLTGGKAVFHNKELTYSFIVPEKLNLLSKNINDSYYEIAQALAIALKKLGLNPEMRKVPEKILTPICFNSANWYELTVNNKKISGSAQRRFDGKILQHGPILLDFDYYKNSILFNSTNNLDNIENLKKRITSLKQELNKEISINAVKEAIKYGFQKYFNFDIVEDSLSKEEMELTEKLRKEKYSTDEWNYRLLTKIV